MDYRGLCYLLNRSPGSLRNWAKELTTIRQAARAEYAAKYTAERNYQMLMDVYSLAIRRHRERTR